MHYSKREYLVNNIIAGCVLCNYEGQPVFVYEPSPIDKVKAHSVYLKEYKNAELYDVNTEEEMLQIMITNGLWKDVLQKELDGLPKAIEELKVELYNAYFQFKRRDNIKKSIHSLRLRQYDLITQRDKFKANTCEGFASTCKNRFLICSGAKNIDGTPFFTNDYESYPQSSLDLFIQEYLSQKIDDDTIRELSKDEPWKSIWGCGKHEIGIFGVPSSLLSYEQKLIIIWSKLYDSIYESPDCPPEEVVEDNDALDGWLIVEGRKREQDRKSQHGYKPGDKFNKADEVFIVVENPEDVSRVESMNSPAAIIRKQQRANALTKAGGKLADQHMPDAQATMREQLVNMQKKNMRK